MVLRPASEWTFEDWDKWFRRVDDYAAKAKASGVKQWFGMIDPEAVYMAPARGVEDGSVQAVIVDGYAVLFGIGYPWYNPKVRILQEYLVTRLDDSVGDFNVVVDALDQLALEYQCNCIVVGNALSFDDRLERVYKRKGYRREAVSLIKEVSHGTDHPE